MARDQKQMFLNAPECSGRGVRCRVLGPSELDQVLLVGATVAGATASALAIRVAASREGVKRMLVSVTSKGDLTAEDLQTATWVDLDASKLEMPGPLSYDELFTGKDDAILSALYRRLHEPSQGEVESIVGKALPVSAG